MAVIGNAMGRKTLWVYLSSIIGGALLFGILVNELIPRQWITGFIPVNLHEGQHEHPAGWLQWTSSALLVLLIINGYVLKYLRRRRNRIRDKSRTTQMKSQIHKFRVEGMTCNHCKASVENGVGRLPSVTSVVADPDLNMVTVEAVSVTDSSIREAVEGLGYAFKGKF
jgi:copper chaperone CopZ